MFILPLENSLPDGGSQVLGILTIAFAASTHDGVGQVARNEFKFSLNGATFTSEGQRIIGGSLAEIKEHKKLQYLLIFCMFVITTKVFNQQTRALT